MQEAACRHASGHTLSPPTLFFLVGLFEKRLAGRCLLSFFFHARNSQPRSLDISGCGDVCAGRPALPEDAPGNRTESHRPPMVRGHRDRSECHARSASAGLHDVAHQRQTVGASRRRPVEQKTYLFAQGSAARTASQHGRPAGFPMHRASVATMATPYEDIMCVGAILPFVARLARDARWRPQPSPRLWHAVFCMHTCRRVGDRFTEPCRDPATAGRRRWPPRPARASVHDDGGRARLPLSLSPGNERRLGVNPGQGKGRKGVAVP